MELERSSKGNGLLGNMKYLIITFIALLWLTFHAYTLVVNACNKGDKSACYILKNHPLPFNK